MGKVISFDARIVQAQVPRLAAELKASGVVTTRDSDAGVLPATWRRAARAAARSLGRKVRTSHVNNVLCAELLDWPRDATERAAVDRGMREVTARMAVLFDPVGARPQV